MTAAARSITTLVALAALAVLLGYAMHIQALVVVLPGLQGMSVCTASGLLALAIALLADSWGRRRIAVAAGDLGLATGLALLLVDIVAGRDVVSPWLAARLFGFDPATAGRTSPATAACLAAVGGALLLRGRRPWPDLLGAATMIVSGLALLGYAYGAHELYAVPVFHTMALHTAIGLFCLAAAVLTMHPQHGVAAVIASRGPGGNATRRQLAFMMLPPAVGAVLLQATDVHHLGPGAAMAFLVMVTVVPLAILILRDGRAIDALTEERRRGAEMQAQHVRDLEERLAAQAEDLRRQNAERVRAEQLIYRNQRLEAVGQLTGGIAHDFNNLLMAVGGNLQLMAKRLPEDHPTRRYILNAQAASERGAKLTAQLLAFSRTQKLDIRPVELDPVLRKCGELLGSVVGPNVALQVRPGARGAWAMADPDQLELAVINLALNARDAMPDGGELLLESRPCRTRLRPGDADSDFAVVRVRDTGAGMSAEVAAQAVEPFFTTKARGEGAGLGLTQVYGFVRQCGGDIGIDSEPGRGTAIEMLFPMTAPPRVKAAEAPAQRAGGQAPAGRLLLVIDDDDSVRAVLVDTLRHAGFEVIEARNGAEGLELLKGASPAAAIIDFIMPGLNGAEVARLAQRRQPGLPIIFVSGYYDTVALDGIAGAVVLRKPFDVEGLQQTVSSVLQ